jgi:hypothetical protein
MKIYVEKVTTDPPHALTVKQVADLIRLVPKEWLRHIRRVNLKATLPSHSTFQRPVISSYFNGLNVCCRGLKPEVAQKEILRELAISGLRLTTRYGYRLSREELKKLDEIIAPYLKSLRDQKADDGAASE